MFNVDDKVELQNDVVFDYGTVAYTGEIYTISCIDNEGYWLKENKIYIAKGYENKYLKKC